MNERIKKYLSGLEEKLLNGEKKLFEISSDWVNSFPEAAGVVVVQEEGKICFVEATKNIRKTVSTMLETAGHLLRQEVGYSKFSGIRMKNGKQFFSEIEFEINQIFQDNFEVAVLEVPLGRTELEEALVKKYTPKYQPENSKKQKKTYSIEAIRKEHRNAYTPWTTEEESQLLALKKAGKTTREIAEILKRKSGAITSRLKKISERELQ